LLFGIVLVGGLVGEYFADHKKKEYPRFKKHKRLFEQMVIVGVLGELLADGGIFSFGQRMQIIADGENAILYTIAKQAGKDSAASYERARIAEQKAGEANERAANTESNNLVLRSNVVALEIKLKPRTITTKQVEDFIFLTEKVPKIPIAIEVGTENGDNLSYAYQIRSLLSAGNFAVADANTIWGLKTSSVVTARKMGMGADPIPYMHFFTYSTNDVVHPPAFVVERTNGFERPINISSNETYKVYAALRGVFNEIGITAEWWGTELVSSNEFRIFINPRGF